jgi:hypothetical protein
VLAIMFLHDIIIDRPSNKEWFMFIDQSREYIAFVLLS